jgi:ABC-type multidrug transport system ATPase subunit
MIELDAVSARAAPNTLLPWTARFTAGTYALLGTHADGVGLALDVIAGRARPTGGRIAVGGAAPRTEGARRMVAHVPLEVALPDAMRVEEALHLASSIRGEPALDAATRLRELGVESLARRPVRTLTQEEARAVSLTEALTSTAVKVLLIEEPLAFVDPRAAVVLARALRERARGGACIVMTTTSTRDARTLADQALLFERGAMVRQVPTSDSLVLAGAGGFEMVVLASDTRALVGELGREAAVREMTTRAGAIVLRGNDATELARAVAGAVLRSGATLESMTFSPLELEEVRASFAGDLAGIYRAAYERATAQAVRT